jgi:hypothetical protein
MAWDANLAGGTLFVGTADGGIWSTTDGGTSWSVAATSDSAPSLTIDSIAVDTTDVTGKTLYAGTGEQADAYDALFGQGVLKTINGGATWTQTGTPTTFGRDTISRVVVDPATGDVYAAASSGSYGGSGVFMSSNGGTSWTNTSNLASQNVSDLAIDSVGDLYAAVGDSIGAQADNGVWECLAPCATTNAFTVIGGGTAPGPVGGAGFPAGNTIDNVKISIAPISGGAPTHEAIYAIASNDASNNLPLGVYQANGTGATFKTTPPTWTKVGQPTDFTDFGPRCNSPGPVEIPACYENQAWYDMYVWADPHDTSGNTAYFGLSDIYKTTNGLSSPATWTNLTNVYGAGGSGVHPDQHAMTSNGAMTLFFGNDGGAWDSTTAGTSFNDINGNLTTLQFYGGGLGTAPIGSGGPCASNCDPTARIGGLQDNGTAQTTGGALAWTAAGSGFFGDGGYALVDPTNNNIRYGENANGGVGYSIDAGTTFSDSGIGNTCGSSNFMAPMTLDPATHTTMFVGMRDLCETTSASSSPSWTDVSGGTSNIAASPNGASESGSTVTLNLSAALSFAPLAGSIVTVSGVGVVGYNGTFALTGTPTTTSLQYTDTNTGLANSGGGTANVNLTPGAIASVAVSHAGATAAIYMSDSSGNTYYSINNGTNWTSMDTGTCPGPICSLGLRTGQGPGGSWAFGPEVTSVAADPATKGVVYAVINGFQGGSGTGHVFKWTNSTLTGNGTWTDIGAALPDEPYDTVAINPVTPNIIYVGGITGAFVTSNGGATWFQMGTGLPNVQVDSLTVSADGNTIVAWTHGRSAWLTNANPTAVDFTREQVSVSHGWTTIKWHATVRVAGFNVYAGQKQLNQKLVTSKSLSYSFRAHWVTKHPRLVAVPLH